LNFHLFIKRLAKGKSLSEVLFPRKKLKNPEFFFSFSRKNCSYFFANRLFSSFLLTFGGIIGVGVITSALKNFGPLSKNNSMAF